MTVVSGRALSTQPSVTRALSSVPIDPIEVGDIAVGISASTYFMLHNDKATSVQLRLAEKDCSCLTLEFGSSSLLSGESTWCHMAIVPNAFGKQCVRAKIQLSPTSDLLTIAANYNGIAPRYWVAPEFVDLGLIDEHRGAVEFMVSYRDVIGLQAVAPRITWSFSELNAVVTTSPPIKDHGGLRYDISVLSSHNEFASTYGFVTGSLGAELPELNSGRDVLILGNLAPSDVSEWPECFVLLGSDHSQSRVLKFPEELHVTDVHVERPHLAGIGEVAARWDSDRHSLEVSYQPAMGERESLTGMSNLALATNRGWVNVFVMVTP